MSLKQEIISDIVFAYKNFCSRNRLVEDETTVEYFVNYFVNTDTKAGYKRAEKLRACINRN